MNVHRRRSPDVRDSANEGVHRTAAPRRTVERNHEHGGELSREVMANVPGNHRAVSVNEDFLSIQNQMQAQMRQMQQLIEIMMSRGDRGGSQVQRLKSCHCAQLSC